jgi:hypothetical protein
MPDEALADLLETSAERLLAEKPPGSWVSPDDVAGAVGVDPQDVGLHDAWREIQKRGKLNTRGWPDSGMGIPQQIGL